MKSIMIILDNKTAEAERELLKRSYFLLQSLPLFARPKNEEFHKSEFFGFEKRGFLFV